MHLDEVIFIKLQAQCQETVIFQPSNYSCHPKQYTDRSNVLIIFEWISLVKVSISGKNGLNGTGWSTFRISLKFTIIIISIDLKNKRERLRTIILFNLVSDAPDDMLSRQGLVCLGVGSNLLPRIGVICNHDRFLPPSCGPRTVVSLHHSHVH